MNIIKQFFSSRKDIAIISKEKEIEFKNQEIITLHSTIKDLQEQIREKDKIIYEFLKKPSTEHKKDTEQRELTRKEKKIYDYFMKNPTITKKSLAKALKLKENSLKVYISRVRSKNNPMNFKEDEY